MSTSVRVPLALRWRCIYIFFGTPVCLSQHFELVQHIQSEKMYTFLQDYKCIKVKNNNNQKKKIQNVSIKWNNINPSKEGSTFFLYLSKVLHPVDQVHKSQHVPAFKVPTAGKSLGIHGIHSKASKPLNNILSSLDLTPGIKKNWDRKRNIQKKTFKTLRNLQDHLWTGGERREKTFKSRTCFDCGNWHRIGWITPPI